MTPSHAAAAADRPYAGLSVLDLSQGVAGPYCGTLFALDGADVIKVEPPAGDWCRGLGRTIAGTGALAIASNLGKRSIVIDAGKPRGRELVRTLATRADVLIESFRPGVVEKLGVDYRSVSAANPRIVYCSITAFGERGPWARKAGTDSVLQAYTGMTHVNRDAGGAPRRLGLLVPDTITALYAAQRVQAALYARERSGHGAQVQVSLAECCAAFQSAPILDAALFAEPPPPNNVPAGVFRTADGWLSLLALNDAMWPSLCRALGRDDWLADERLARHADRAAIAAQINASVAEQLLTAPTAAWIDRLERHDVLCAEALDYRGFREHPQTRHMGWFAPLTQPSLAPVFMPGLPGARGDAPLPPAPRSGEHTHAVLAALGLTDDEIAALEQAGVVRQEQD